MIAKRWAVPTLRNCRRMIAKRWAVPTLRNFDKIAQGEVEQPTSGATQVTINKT